MLQYKNTGGCNYRYFEGNNGTALRDGVYNIETYLHEALAGSSHRCVFDSVRNTVTVCVWDTPFPGS